MKASRYSTSRQKACNSCSTAKAKCNRKVGRCTRCAVKSLSYSYTQLPLSGGSPASTIGNADVGVYGSASPLPPNSTNTLSNPGNVLPSPECGISAATDPQSSTAESALVISDASPTDPTNPTDSSTETFTGNYAPRESRLEVPIRPPKKSEILDFSELELFSPINVDDISNRWLHPYIPVSGQKVKNYPPTITSLIYRILKSYVTVAVRGRAAPPFVHASQVMSTSTSPPLSTCLSLIRICENPLPGSEGVVADVLGREMNNLYEQYVAYDNVTQLAAFQAYLIYSMALFFRLGQISGPFLRQAMMNLQQLACSSGRAGLMCIAEQQHTRPKWEAWIVAEAKRRTLYVMYLFDSVLSTQDGLQTFLGTELQGLPAPRSKCLWRAQTRQEWEIVYNIYLADWLAEGLRIDELWPMPADLSEPGRLQRRNRVDTWLENVDEFGTMIYAVTSCTHG
ncbi:hypothetical protein F5B19DRAFT_474792 [Rostrohypoxylon terebratum]|nr:hypothetical protein F5B19DRAFT_474792 [Rostrohypoxylon terebratum]